MKLRTAIAAALLATGLAALSPITLTTAHAAAINAIADVSGTYTWSGGMGGGGGGGGNENTLVLKQDGTKLTGTLTGGRGGEAQIEEGTVDGNAIKFAVTREWNGYKLTTHYEGTVEGDTLKLKIITTREIEAKKKA